MFKERNSITSNLSGRHVAILVMVLHILGVLCAGILTNLLPASSPALFVCIGMSAILGFMIAVVLGFAHFSVYILILFMAMATALWKNESDFWPPVATLAGALLPVALFAFLPHRILRSEREDIGPVPSGIPLTLMIELKQQLLVIEDLVGMQGKAAELLAETTTRLVDGDEILLRGTSYQSLQIVRTQNDNDQLIDLIDTLGDHLLSLTSLLAATDGHNSIVIRKLAEIAIPTGDETVLYRSLKGESDGLKLAIRLTGEIGRTVEQCRYYLNDAGNKKTVFNNWLKSVESTLRSRSKAMSELKESATSLNSSINRTHGEYSDLNAMLDRII